MISSGKNRLGLIGFLITGLCFAFISPFSATQPLSEESLKGAWKQIASSSTEDYYEGYEVIKSMSEGYFMVTVFNEEKKQFKLSWGGSYEIQDDQLIEKIEFHTQDSAKVGMTQTYNLTFADTRRTVDLKSTDLKKFGHMKLTRVDKGDETPLAAAWRITQRQNDEGEMVPMKMGPRKTIKLLTGTRFQWSAINTETGQFFGTGGGTYTLEEGTYTEHIQFFSRDSSRVGKSLSFEAEVKGNDWIHEGLSSKGDPIKEIWTDINSL